MCMRSAVRPSITEHGDERCATALPRGLRALFVASAPRASLQPLRRSRSGRYVGRCCEAVHAKAQVGRPSFGGRRATELHHQRMPVTLSTWQRLCRSQAILLKARLRRSTVRASVHQPASNLGLPNPALQPTCYGWLRQPAQAAERKR